MLFKTLVLTILLVLTIYILGGIIAACFIRYKNPLKKAPCFKQTIYLTFDDGIDSRYTPLLLDLLKKHCVQATFFIVASTISNNLAILQRIKEDGHLIGLHSFNHKNQILQSPWALKKDFKKSMELFEISDIKVDYYRPPWGHIRLFGVYMCKIHQLKIVLWTAIVQDWRKSATQELLFEKLRYKVHGNSVICLHDGRGKDGAPLKTISALEKIIPIWKGEGYSFETIAQFYQKTVN